eukprot:7249056-Pyramimonas_sp.AAC.1
MMPPLARPRRGIFDHAPRLSRGGAGSPAFVVLRCPGGVVWSVCGVVRAGHRCCHVGVPWSPAGGVMMSWCRGAVVWCRGVVAWCVVWCGVWCGVWCVVWCGV